MTLKDLAPCRITLLTICSLFSYPFISEPTYLSLNTSLHYSSKFNDTQTTLTIYSQLLRLGFWFHNFKGTGHSPPWDYWWVDFNGFLWLFENHIPYICLITHIVTSWIRSFSLVSYHIKTCQHYWEEVCRSPLFPRCPTRAVDILRVHSLSLEPKTLSISYSLLRFEDSNLTGVYLPYRLMRTTLHRYRNVVD